MRRSQAVISLITPNSNNNPWILFESGYAEALAETKLIPLKFLISINEVSIPLQHKQIFSISNIEEANVFLRKVLDSFDIIFDEVVFNDYVSCSLNEMRSCFQKKDNIVEENSFELLSTKMDNYFDMILKTHISHNQKQLEYEIPIEFINASGNKIIEYIKINPTVRLCDVLDSLFFLLYGKVGAYRYLEEWIVFFATDCEISQRPLTGRIIDWYFTIGQEYLEIFLLIQTVVQTFGSFTFRKNRLISLYFTDPRKELLNQRFDVYSDGIRRI